MAKSEPVERAAVIDDDGNIVARVRGVELIRRMVKTGQIAATDNPQVFVQTDTAATASAAPPPRLTPAERRHAERMSAKNRRRKR